MTEIIIDELIRGNRRTLSLHISPEGKLVVKAPHLMPRFVIHRFVEEKREWIEKKIWQVKRMPIKRTHNYATGESFLYLGNIYPLELDPARKEIGVSDKLYVPHLPPVSLKIAIVFWYKSQARRIILERCKALEKKTGLAPTSILLSDAKTKWGTCFHDDTMNFSWRLIMAPLSVIDYVVAHEFAHMKVKNHSKKFWDTVGSFCPLYKVERRWLKKNGPMLDL